MRLPGLVLQGILARAALVFLRLYLGFVFVLSFWLQFRAEGSLPDAPVTGSAIIWSELLVGISLILGLMTRLSAAAALILSVNYLLSSVGWVDVRGSGDATYAAVSIALLIGAAGRTLGLDAILARRWPRSPLW